MPHNMERQILYINDPIANNQFNMCKLQEWQGPVQIIFLLPTETSTHSEVFVDIN